MSGARALASARRRRAAPDPSRPNQPPLSKPNQQIARPPLPPGAVAEQQQKLNNPALMLLNHNKIIENLQEVVTSLSEKVNDQDKAMDQKIKELSLDETNIEFFKEKVLNIERELNTIKRHILKVQTFAMETNVQCIELRKKIDSPEISVEEEQNQTHEITELLSVAEEEHDEDDNEFA